MGEVDILIPMLFSLAKLSFSLENEFCRFMMFKAPVYKRLVRIMKHIKNEMVEDKKTDGDKITSFLVECLVYHVPNNVITGYSTWTETVKKAIIYLYNEIKDGHHTEWGEVSDMLYLFRNRKWTDEDAKQWLITAWNYLGYGE